MSQISFSQRVVFSKFVLVFTEHYCVQIELLPLKEIELSSPSASSIADVSLEYIGEQTTPYQISRAFS